MFCVVCVCVLLFIAILLQPCIWSLNFLSFISFVFVFDCLLQHYIWCTNFLNFVLLCMNQLHDRFVVMDPSPSFEIPIWFFIFYFCFHHKSCTKSFPKTLWILFSFVFDFNLETIITTLQLVFVILPWNHIKSFQMCSYMWMKSLMIEWSPNVILRIFCL